MDQRIVYGNNCSWWEKIGKASILPSSGLPCCPHCKGVLLEVESMAEWYAMVEEYERKGNPRYRDFVEWTRGKCFLSSKIAKQSYLLEN